MPHQASWCRAPALDWSGRMDRLLSRWNRRGRPERLRPEIKAMTEAFDDWFQARNRLIGVVERLEQELTREEAS